MLKVWTVFLTLTISFVCALAQDVSIYDIQHTTDASGNSPLVGQTVSTGGIVTALGYLGPSFNYYFISDRSGGLWHGILVNDNQDRNLAVGDSVHLVAEVQEASGQTRLRNVQSGSKIEDSAHIAPVVVTCREVAEPAEGVLVEIHNVIVTAVNSQDFTVTDGDSSATIGSGWPHIMPSLGDTLVSVRGLVTSSGTTFKVNPRNDFDLTFTSNRAPVIASVQADPANPSSLVADTITARITDETVVADARVIYRFGNSPYDTLSMFDDGQHGDGSAADHIWGAIIPAGVPRSTCYYYVWAADDSGKVSTDPPTAPAATHSYVVSPTMADIYAHYSDYNNASVTLTGIVNFVEPYITSGGSSRITVYMQDQSGRGFCLAGSGGAADYPLLVRGNEVTIAGTISTYNGAIQLGITSSAGGTLVASNRPMPTPVFVKTGDRTLQHQIVATSAAGAYCTGTFCKLTGTIYRVDENVGGGTNIAMDDGTGTTTIRLWDSMNIDSIYIDSVRCPIHAMLGKYMTLCGPASTYNGDFQLLAGGDVSDFSVPTFGAPSPELVLDLPNRPFAPEIGQKLKISYNAPAMGQVRLRVFDLRGRLVATIRDKQAGGPEVIDWDGRNELNELLPIGTYIMHLESVQAGNSKTKIKPFVVGAKL